MDKLSFTPEDGLRNSVVFGDPTSETETRQQLQEIPDQIKNFINALIDELNTKGTDAIKGAKFNNIKAGTIKEQLKQLDELKISSENIKGFKFEADNIVYTLDGIEYFALPSSGHIITNAVGTNLPQRKYIKFVDVEVSDDGSNTVVKGIIGAPGKDGTSFQINAQYNTYEDLIAQHPTGVRGDMYLIGAENFLYIWDVDANTYKNVGRMQGAKGDPGEGVPSGGAAGYALVKRTGVDFDTLWVEFYSKDVIDVLLQDKASIQSVNALEQEINTKATETALNQVSNRVTTLEDSINSPVVDYTIPVSSWVGNVATISVPGVTSTSNQDILPAKVTRPNPTSTELENSKAFAEAGFQDAGQENGKIYIYATKVPTKNINIRIVKRGNK